VVLEPHPSQLFPALIAARPALGDGVGWIAGQRLVGDIPPSAAWALEPYPWQLFPALIAAQPVLGDSVGGIAGGQRLVGDINALVHQALIAKGDGQLIDFFKLGMRLLPIEDDPPSYDVFIGSRNSC
jgi:hypothetical protein